MTEDTDQPIASNEVTINSQIDEDGATTAQPVLTEDADKNTKIIECDVRPSIPVIFLPGVMGTLLRLNDKKKTRVWSPPNADSIPSAIGALFSVLAWHFTGAASRQTQLNAEKVEVDDTGPISVGISGINKKTARQRGWGQIHRWSYHDFLGWLHHQLNFPMLRGEPNGIWHQGDPSGEDGPFHPILGTEPSTYGAQRSAAAINASDQAFLQFSSYQYPVYAIGYNWLQSNQQSAEDVAKQIAAICKKLKAPKAIVITHSMGGIVARAVASMVPGGADLIYGIVHGAQPATGAPIASKRFRTGAEGFVAGSLFGSNDTEWAAVAANSPAALELMPMPDYRNGAPWWLVRRGPATPDRHEQATNNAQLVMALPATGSSTSTDVYLNETWFGLLPDEKIIDPSGAIKKLLQQTGNNESLRSVFESQINASAKFQEKLTNEYHSNTYALYGENILAKENEPGAKAEKLRSWGEVVWQGPLPLDITEYELRTAKLLEDNHQGLVAIELRGKPVQLAIQPAEQFGDGTVPAESAAAQARGIAPTVTGNPAKGMQQVFIQGGYEHQFCYNHAWARWATLYSVVQIAQSLPPGKFCS